MNLRRLIGLLAILFLTASCRKEVRKNHVFIIPPAFEGVLEICDCDEDSLLADKASKDSLIYDLREGNHFCSQILYNTTPTPTQDMHFYKLGPSGEYIPLTTTYLKIKQLEEGLNRENTFVSLEYMVRRRDCVSIFIGRGKDIEQLLMASLRN